MKFYDDILHDWTGGGEYLFPPAHSRGSIITDVTLLNGLQRLGYTREKMTIHGFRGIASTLLNVMGFNSDLIESQQTMSHRKSPLSSPHRRQ